MASRTLNVVLAGDSKKFVRALSDGEKRAKAIQPRAQGGRRRRHRRADRRRLLRRPAGAGDRRAVQGGQGLGRGIPAARGPGPADRRTRRRPLRRAARDDPAPAGGARPGHRPGRRRAATAGPHRAGLPGPRRALHVRQAARRHRLGRRLRPAPAADRGIAGRLVRAAAGPARTEHRRVRQADRPDQRPDHPDAAVDRRDARVQPPALAAQGPGPRPRAQRGAAADRRAGHHRRRHGRPDVRRPAAGRRLFGRSRPGTAGHAQGVLHHDQGGRHDHAPRTTSACSKWPSAPPTRPTTGA